MADSVNILIAVKDVASKEIDKAIKAFSKLDKAVFDSAKNTDKAEGEAARATTMYERMRQLAIMGSINRLKTLNDHLKFLYSGKGISGGLLGTASAIAGFEFAKLAAQSDQVRISFLNTFGDKAGSVLDSVRKATKGIIDDTTIMRESLKTSIAGIRGVEEIPEIFKLGAVAAQRLGIDASEGVDLARKAVVEFNESSMEQLGIINKLDPAFRTQMAIIEQQTKGLGQYLAIQYKLNYVLGEARKRYGDNYSVLETNMQAFQFLGAAVTNVRNVIGYLIGDALAPMARGFATALSSVVQFINYVRADKTFRESALNVIKFTATLLGMISALSIAKLAFMALGAVFSGPFGVLGAFIAIAAAVKAVKMGAEDFTDALKRISQGAVGVFQLVASFFQLNNGFAQINKNIADFLGPAGLQMVVTVAQGVIHAINVIDDLANGMTLVFRPIMGIIGDFLRIVFGTDVSQNNIFTDLGKSIAYLLDLIRPLLAALDHVVSFAITGLGAIIDPSAGFRKRLEQLQGGQASSHMQDVQSENPDRFVSAQSYVPQPTATAESVVSSNTVTQAPASVPQAAPQSNEDLARLISQAVMHLQRIDDKTPTSRRNVFEDKLLAGSN